MSIKQGYGASDIEVLEGLEPVRKRPGMYIGGRDQNAIHHMFNEIIDNSMDEAVAGFANKIEITLEADGTITIADNGRGIPVEEHPKFPGKSTLEVIMTTLHSGGKFNTNVYATSGGLHGVGISVVNALSIACTVEIKRDGNVYAQSYKQGITQNSIEITGKVGKKNTGTKVSFMPDEEIFGRAKYNAEHLYKTARAKAYLFKGVTIKWKCLHEESRNKTGVLESDTIHYPNGIKDYVSDLVAPEHRLTPEIFYLEADVDANVKGKVECAFVYQQSGNMEQRYYCNTIHSPIGGTHEQGFKAMLLKVLRNYATMVNFKGFDKVIGDDVIADITIVLSIFIPNPSFQGQTKDKLLSREAVKMIDVALRDRLEHILINNPKLGTAILDHVVENANYRLKRKANSREASRKNPMQSLRLPGKLTDCYDKNIENTEIMLVEGESAGGTARQARDRNTQAILPLKGKILNVANNSATKIDSNQEISDLITALGCGIGKHFDKSKLRYGKIIIMTDADVDGAHICALILTFFFIKMPELVQDGNIYLVKPPLYRITQKGQAQYVYSDAEKDTLLAKLSKQQGKIEVNRFKGLGEMTAKQLKETTMNRNSRTLYQVQLRDAERNEDSLPDDDQYKQIALTETTDLVESLMGKKPELRFKFIKEYGSII